MNYSKTAFRIACWSFIIVGAGHIATDLLTVKTSEQTTFLQSMKDFSIILAGTEITIFSFYQGFSIMMGMLLLAYGVLNLIILKNVKEANVRSNIILFNILISLLALILSIMYFFIIPISLTAFAFFAFTISFIKKRAMQSDLIS